MSVLARVDSLFDQYTNRYIAASRRDVEPMNDAVPVRMRRMLGSGRPGSFLAGLIGAGISRSLSPALHETEGLELGLHYVYRLIDIDGLGGDSSLLAAILAAMELTGFCGTNVTFPCKQTILDHVDELSSDAEAIGAVNTLVFANGRRIGHNTDSFGFAENFRRGLEGAATNVVVQVGAGGAGAAAGHAASGLGVGELRLFDVDRTRAERLAARIREQGSTRVEVTADLAAALRDADGLVNATPIGMLGHPGTPVDPAYLRADMWVADVVYVPLETELLKAARALGCRTLHGGGMVVFQAARGFRLFTGREADSERMLRHFGTISAAAP
jgi:shikimate dehydrogenase